MTKGDNHGLAAFDRVVEFTTEHTITPPIARVTALVSEVVAAASAVRLHSAEQDDGNAVFIDGAALRRQRAEEVRVQMRPINFIARKLKNADYPDIRAQFRMAQTGSYEGLLARGRAFLSALAGPGVKKIFTDRGLDPGFDVAFKAKVDAFETAAQKKYKGLLAQVSGTGGVRQHMAAGVEALRELDGILSLVYQSDPPLLAAWKTACHIERPPESEASKQKRKAKKEAAATGANAPAPTPSPTGTTA